MKSCFRNVRRFTFLFIGFFMITLSAYPQWDYGTSFSNSAPPASYIQVQNQQHASFMLDSLQPPYPTNAWFDNFILPKGAWGVGNGLQYDTVGYFPSFPQPYCVGFTWFSTGLIKSTPYKMLGIGYSPYTIANQASGTYSVTWSNAQTLFVGTRDSSNLHPFMKKFDDLSMTIRWRDTSNVAAGYMEAPIVRGMPYFSMYYHNFRPLLYTPSPPLVSVNGINVLGINDSTDITGTRFRLVLEGAPSSAYRQIWMLYSSVPVTLRFKYKSISCVDLNYTGYIRLAYVTTRLHDPNAADSTLRIALLDQYSKFIPTGGKFNASIGSDTSIATTSFNFTTTPAAGDSLLMMALPHHIGMLSNPTSSTLKLACIKGQMTEVYGKNWVMTDSLPDISWYETANLDNVASLYRDSLLLYLQKDYDSLCGRRAYSIWNGTNAPASDVYGFGKTSAKLARLAVIADELSQWYPVCDTIASGIRDTLKFFINRYLDGRSNPVLLDLTKIDSLYYDTRFGGMISSLSYTNGYYEDFGNALYNDHHFHYGYLTYTAAVIARKDTAWASAYKDKVLALIRDISNPDSSDAYFVRNRLLDWYDGNSWAKGMEGSGSGRNQESSSEAVNAWYSVYLYGMATHDENIKNTGKLMLSSEIRAAQAYYHIPPSSQIYPASYTNAWKIVGNLWSAGIDNQTFFGSYPRYVYGIHIIPVTPATKFLWDADYASYLYNYSNLGTDSVFSTLPTSTAVKNWTSICFPVQALADIDAALANFKTYHAFNGNFDGGASKTNTYYWLICHKHDPNLLIVGTNEFPEESHQTSVMNVYPNPASDIVNLELSLKQAGLTHIYLTDYNGKFVTLLLNAQLEKGTKSLQFDFSKLPTGAYFCVLRQNNYTETKSLIHLKERSAF